MGEGGRETQKAWERGVGGSGQGQEGLTFRALPESVGFHAEGGAEALFTV